MAKDRKKDKKPAEAPPTGPATQAEETAAPTQQSEAAPQQSETPPPATGSVPGTTVSAETGSDVSSDLEKTDGWYCDTCKKPLTPKEAKSHQKKGHTVIDDPNYRAPGVRTTRKDDATGMPIIFAKDCELGKEYLTVGMRYKVKVLKKFGEGAYVSSVLVESETEPHHPINIAGGTELIAYREDLHVPVPTKPKSNKQSQEGTVAKEKKAKEPKTPKEPKVKMSDIINPMLLEGKHTAEEVADAVVKQFPEKKDEYDKLVLQIKGPRLYNLTKDAKTNKGKKPALVASKADEKKAAAKKAEKAGKGKGK